LYSLISLVGNAKNAGKTTVLNHLIQECGSKRIGITSIGLDGEKIDQITNLPKPRIHVKPKMLVATAKECLRECEAGYKILKTTDLYTALGPIVIIEITAPGNCLVGGPSTITKMKKVIREFRRLGIKNILVDGAFSRSTFSQIGGAVIFCVGASYSQDMGKVVSHAQNTIKQFQLPKFDQLSRPLGRSSKIQKIYQDGDRKTVGIDSTLGNGKSIIETIGSDVRFLYVPKAVSQSFLKEFVKERQRLKCDLIVSSPTHLMVDEQLLKHLFLLDQKIYVLHPMKLAAIAYNPFSPTGYAFSNEQFKAELQKVTDLPVINVLESQK